MIRSILTALAMIASASHAEVLIEGDLIVGIQTTAEMDETTELLVTGAYTSGDRDNIEGLAIIEGDVISVRYQNWDGVLIIDRDGKASVMNKRRVDFGDSTYDLTDIDARQAFVSAAQLTQASVLQSHLLITDGEMDVRPVENAPRFVRRVLYTKGTEVGIYETATPQTLYDTGIEIIENVMPDTALNLDMGAFNYCRARSDETIKSCGDPYVPVDTLTNFISVSNLEDGNSLMQNK